LRTLLALAKTLRFDWLPAPPIRNAFERFMFALL
jgi:hypothetical protein